MAKKVVNIAIQVDGKQAKNLIKTLKKDFKGLDPVVDNTTKGFGNLGKVVAAGVAAVGIRELSNLTAQVFELGSAVEETESKFVTSLGNQADAGREFLDEYSTLLGLTNVEAQNFLATQVNIANGLGFTAEASFDLSKEVIKLAGDLASFNNIPIERTLNAIQGGLTGEREALKSLGIVVRQEDVNQRALLNTGKERVAQLTEQEKSLASFQLITERSGAAVGDLERTQDSAANQARQLKAEIGDLANNIAVLFLPALAKGVSELLKFTENVKFLLDTNRELKSELALTDKVTTSFAESMGKARLEIAQAIQAGNLNAEQLQELETAYESVQRKIATQVNLKKQELDALYVEKAAIEETLQSRLEKATVVGEEIALNEKYQPLIGELNTKISQQSKSYQELNALLFEGATSYQELIDKATQSTQATQTNTDSVDNGSSAYDQFRPKIEAVKDEFAQLNKILIDTGFQFESIEDIIDGADFNLPGKIAPPGSIAFLQQELEALREQLAYTTDPETVRELNDQISLIDEQIINLGINAENSGFREYLQSLSDIATDFAINYVQGGIRIQQSLEGQIKKIRQRANEEGKLATSAEQAKEIQIQAEKDIQAARDAADAQRKAQQKSAISQTIAQVAVDMILSVVKGLPFPANLIAAPVAAAGITALANSFVNSLPGFADGGLISGEGGEREDKILARLSDGEFVVNAKSTKEYFPLLKAINNGENKDTIVNKLPRFADGGLVSNKESLITAMARESNTQSIADIGSTQPDIVSAIKEAFEDLVLPKIQGEIDNDVIRLSLKESTERLNRNTIQIGI